MGFKNTVKAALKKTKVGRSVIAKRNINYYSNQILLKPEEVRKGMESPEKQEELVAGQKKKFPEHWKQQNDRIDWLVASPLNKKEDLDVLRNRMLFYYFSYGFTPSEFLAYDLADKTVYELKEYISDRGSVRYAHRINDTEAIALFFDKNRTYEVFKTYFCRDAVAIHTAQDHDSFCDFVKKHPVFVKKDARESCGRGIELVDTTGFSAQETKVLFDEYVTNGNVILEEKIKQSGELNVINQSTVNTVRCLTLVTKHGVIVPWCFGKLGRAGFFIDNGAAGGLLAGIDVQTGTILPDSCCDEFGNRYKTHPDNGLEIEGFRYPEWDEMIRICKEMATVVPGARWIGWDMAHTEKGWVVVEGNSVTEVIGPQSTLQRGIRKEFDDYLRDVQTVF